MRWCAAVLWWDARVQPGGEAREASQQCHAVSKCRVSKQRAEQHAAGAYAWAFSRQHARRRAAVRAVQVRVREVGALPRAPRARVPRRQVRAPSGS